MFYHVSHLDEDRVVDYHIVYRRLFLIGFEPHAFLLHAQHIGPIFLPQVDFQMETGKAISRGILKTLEGPSRHGGGLPPAEFAVDATLEHGAEAVGGLGLVEGFLHPVHLIEPFLQYLVLLLEVFLLGLVV